MAALAASFFAPGAAALAREKTTAHARRSTKNSTATRAAVKSDETAISKPFEALVEATSTHPVAAARSESFARTPHYKAACERAVNEQINIEYNVSYIYHAMYAYFARDNVYLPGIAKHFLRESLEERGHAELLMNYQIMRGERVELQALMPPQVEYDHPEKGDALYAFELSLSLEKLNNDRLLSLHAVAAECDDANMQDFIEGELLADQVKSIQEISEMVAQLRRMGNKGDAVWHFDQALLDKA
ncbi:ferritin [Micromonas pusilla CCMP1545]|uniref:Ferritin n=1 Tax=Micromonas pusilla (strain CCMP1545) TaxID=564608 RepID=C1N5Q9_MICPC|nr:ferritin [Micromonas pusilla CCMP1545]EEH52539.1 ferritin [Micromonas pusilla CCMP1545]|eukprot:XP_003063403.1 ferritin [Micromonas pusilla CCMP1545]